MVILTAIIFSVCCVISAAEDSATEPAVADDSNFEDDAYDSSANEDDDYEYSENEDDAYEYSENEDDAYDESDYEDYALNSSAGNEDVSYDYPDNENVNHDSSAYETTKPDGEFSEKGVIILKDVKGCRPPATTTTTTPEYEYEDDYTDGDLRRRKKKKTQTESETAPLIWPAPACRKYEKKLKKETKAMLKQQGKPCNDVKYPSKCRMKYMLQARQGVTGPNERCKTQMKQMYGMN